MPSAFLRLLLDPTAVDGGSVADDDFPTRGVEGTTSSAADAGTEHVSDDGLGGGGGAGAAPTPADPNVGAGGTRAQATAQSGLPEGFESVRDSLANRYGLKLDPQIQNDEQALAYLVQQAQRAQQVDYYAQLGRQIAPHAEGVQQYLQQQRQAPARKSEWEQPTGFQEKYLALVDQDEKTGLFVGKPGVPAEIVQSVNDYARWYRKVQEDPAGYQEHLFETRFVPKIREIVQAERAQIEQQTVVNDIIRQNAGWLYAKDDQGQVVYQRNGQPALSQAGVRYAQLVGEAQQLGIQGPRNHDAYARRILAAEVQVQNQARQQQAPPATQTQQAMARPNRNPVGSMPARDRMNNPADPGVSNAGLSLRDQMLRDLEGVPDDDFHFN